jgi:hypothetical protein
MRRKETPDLYRKIVRRHLPRGWTVVERDPTDKPWRGLAEWRTHKLYVPPLTDRRALYVALHEIAHARLHTHIPDARIAPHVQEYEAEQLAMSLMRLESIPIPRVELRKAKKDVRGMIEDDRAHGWSIDSHIERWAGEGQW